MSDAYTGPLEHGKVYHLYNRGNNREDLFRDEGNYEHFLKLYAQHILPIAETYCYCLMRNHFHVLLRIRDSQQPAMQQPRANLSGGAPSLQPSMHPNAPPDRFQLRSPSQALANFFNAYARAFNKTKLRTGALFERPFKRIEVDNEPYFIRLITYIHQNPQKHGFVKDFRDWKWSSYSAFIADKPTRIPRDDVLDWFGGLARFVEAHKLIVPFGDIAPLAPEDFD
jgi:REP element-mobilizing transposase RayT